MIVLILAALAFSAIAILIAKIVTISTTNPQKGEPYECGIPTTGKTWVQLNVGYYLFALIFLILIFSLPCQHKIYFIQPIFLWERLR